MADINVQKKGASIWPWILGLLVAALLIWALVGFFDGGDEGIQPMDPASEIGTAPEGSPSVETPNPPTGADM